MDEPHRWEQIRWQPLVWRDGHESLTRSFHILREVEEMLARGDSAETVLAFIRWASG